MNTTDFKISFFTVCMNRLHHLKQTLPVNIIDNKDYDRLEFVILDYNSSDGLEEFIKNELAGYINEGRVTYYKTPAPLYFKRSHSRNLAVRLAGGEIIVNIDADNFTGRGFAAYINKEFKENENIFLSALGNTRSNKQDVLGRICFKKIDFFKVKGYDERMIYYGFEDYDFVNRLKISGLKNMPIQYNEKYLTAIAHSDKERVSNEFVTSNMAFILVNYLTTSTTEIIFFFKNNEFKKGVVVSNKTYTYKEPLTELKRSQLKYKYSIFGDEWVGGTWVSCGGNIMLTDGNINTEELIYNNASNYYTRKMGDNAIDTFYKITDNDLTEEVIMFFSQVNNRLIMDDNEINRRMVVNTDDFGKGTAYKNFNYLEPVEI